MRVRLTCLLGAIIALLASTAGARASVLVSWDYNWTPGVSVIESDSSSTSTLTLSNEPSGSAAGNSDVVATNITTASDAAPGSPATFTNKAYTLAMTLIDTASLTSSTLLFTGEFNGTLSSKNSAIFNTFTGLTTQTTTIGDNTYTVTALAYTPPGPPASTNKGSISFHVDVNGSDTPPPDNPPPDNPPPDNPPPDNPPPDNPPPNNPPPEAPEPSTVLLSALGLLGMGFARWRKWTISR